MKEYMLIYQGGDPDWMTNTTPEDMAAAMARWGAWMEALAAKERLVTGGAPLDYSGKRIQADGVVTDIPAAEFKELVSGYSIVKAADIDEAIKLTEGCPIFEHPEITVEVREVVNTGG